MGEDKQSKIATILQRLLFKLLRSYVKSIMGGVLDSALSGVPVLKDLDKVKEGVLQQEAEVVLKQIFGTNQGASLFSEVSGDFAELEQTLLSDIPTSDNLKALIKQAVLAEIDKAS